MRFVLRSFVSTLVAAGGALAAALPAAAQVSVTAPGPYYATPSWNQTLTANRFVVLTNFGSEAVLDRETGLVWDRAPGRRNRFENFESAQSECISARIGGRLGWRLPTIWELSSLIDPASRGTNGLPAGHPFDVGATNLSFWSVTPFSNGYGVPRSAWVAIFNNSTDPFFPDGNVGTADPNARRRIWCVRAPGGQNTFAPN